MTDATQGAPKAEVGTVVATRPQTARQKLIAALERARPALGEVAARHVSPDRLLKVTLLAATQQPKLFECEPKTIVASVIKAAEMGLEVGGGFGHAYLVPFKNRQKNRMECQLIVGYQGYIELALRTGKVLDISSVLVFEGDHFEYHEGTDRHIKHIPNLDAERTYAKLRYVYMVATLANGVKKVEVMTKKEVEAIRARSQAKDNGPWNTDTLEMVRKTPVRKGQKYLPKTRELATAIALDELSEDSHEGGVLDVMEMTELDEAVPDEQAPKGRTAALREKLQTRTPKPGSQVGEPPAPLTPEEQEARDLAEDRRIAEEEYEQKRAEAMREPGED